MKKLVMVGLLVHGIATHLTAQDSTSPKVPFSDIETNWQNGSDRRDSSVFHGLYFVPSVMVDVELHALL